MNVSSRSSTCDYKQNWWILVLMSWWQVSMIKRYDSLNLIVLSSSIVYTNKRTVRKWRIIEILIFLLESRETRPAVLYLMRANFRTKNCQWKLVKVAMSASVGCMLVDWSLSNSPHLETIHWLFQKLSIKSTSLTTKY